MYFMNPESNKILNQRDIELTRSNSSISLWFYVFRSMSLYDIINRKILNSIADDRGVNGQGSFYGPCSPHILLLKASLIWCVCKCGCRVAENYGSIGRLPLRVVLGVFSFFLQLVEEESIASHRTHIHQSLQRLCSGRKAFSHLLAEDTRGNGSKGCHSKYTNMQCDDQGICNEWTDWWSLWCICLHAELEKSAGFAHFQLSPDGCVWGRRGRFRPRTAGLAGDGCLLLAARPLQLQPHVEVLQGWGNSPGLASANWLWKRHSQWTRWPP